MPEPKNFRQTVAASGPPLKMPPRYSCVTIPPHHMPVLSADKNTGERFGAETGLNSRTRRRLGRPVWWVRETNVSAWFAFLRNSFWRRLSNVKRTRFTVSKTKKKVIKIRNPWNGIVHRREEDPSADSTRRRIALNLRAVRVYKCIAYGSSVFGKDNRISPKKLPTGRLNVNFLLKKKNLHLHNNSS